jgi:serine/threonine-protein kinase RIO1
MNKINIDKKKFTYQKILDYRLLFEEKNREKVLALLVALNERVEGADKYFKNDPGDTTTVAKVSLKGENYVVKRYNFRSIWHKIKLQFRKSHGFRSFYYAHFIKELGIPTIEPIAVIQKKSSFLKLESYFISYYEEGIPASYYFSDHSEHKETWSKTIHEMIKITGLLQENQIYHADYQFGNFIVVNAIPFLLDFDHIKQIQSKRRFQHLKRKDIRNFNRQLVRNKLALEAFTAVTANREEPGPLLITP